MGCDATNYLPKNCSKKDVEEFLCLLGYEKLKSKSSLDNDVTSFYFFKEDDYKYVAGVLCEIYLAKDGTPRVKTHTSIWRSRYDSDFRNWTIKQLKKRFGGYFISDEGKNRYLKYDGPYIERAEGGSYRAYSYFFQNIKKLNSSFD
jgi:hypothetical protein